MKVNQSVEKSTMGGARKFSRPPNRFLAFCQFHRALVARRNPNLENRQITKILGQWWGLLTDKEKEPFLEKTNKHKEDYFQKHPDYKWYTPREKTGNSPVTRLSNRAARKPDVNFNKHFGSALESRGLITPGKLADESQMGGLSSLMGEVREPMKKRCVLVPDVSHIDQDHNYLPTNNNEKIRCAITSCDHTSHQLEGGSPTASNEPPHTDLEEENSCSSDAGSPNDSLDGMHCVPEERQSDPVFEDSSAKDTSLVEYIKDCPVYDYDEFLTRQSAAKREKRKASRRHKSKLLDPASAQDGHRRRRRARTVRMTSTKLRKHVQTAQKPAPSATDSSNYSFADVLLTAAEKLEHIPAI